MNRSRGQRGMSVAVEAALVLPVAMLLVGLVIILAGLALVQQAVDAAAYRAARAASLERSVRVAEEAAYAAAEAELSSSRIRCTNPTVSVDASGLGSPRGSVASVEVSVSCTAQFPVSLPGLPAQRRVSATGNSPVDTYRGRGG